MKHTLSAKRARAILEVYGADPARWPAQERRAMQSRLAEDADLQAVARDHLALDQMLGADRKEAIAEDLQARILAAAPVAAPASRRVTGRIPAFAAAASLLVGSFAGFGGAVIASTTSDPTADLMASAFSEPGAVFEIDMDSGA